VSLIIYQIPYIAANDISTGFFFTTDSFRGLAMQAFMNKFPSHSSPVLMAILHISSVATASHLGSRIEAAPVVNDSDRSG
jgi:hypothetical protein